MVVTSPTCGEDLSVSKISPRTIESGRRIAMTLCPIAITAGCKKCPAFSFCALKTVIGDQVKEERADTSGKNEKQGE